MRALHFLFIAVLLSSCGSDSQPDENNDSTPDSAAHQTRSDCDSTLFPDFKNNLQELLINSLPQYLGDVHAVADSFVTSQCAFDPLFCGEIYQKHLHIYRSPDGYELFSVGYAYVGSDSTMSAQSASFFVFGIRKNGATLYYDIEEDIAGEIQFTLEGFEVVNGKYIVWGESYLFFANEYGKFKLTIDGRDSQWEYMCKSVR